MTDPDGLQAPLEGEGTGEQHPDWFQADKYDSFEAQAKAYADAERRMTSMQSERDRERERADRLEEQIGELAELIQERPQAQQPFDPNANPYVLAYQRAVEEGDVAAQLALQAQLTQAAVEQALTQRQDTNGASAQGPRLDTYSIDRMHGDIASRYESEGESLRDKALEIIVQNPVLSGAMAQLESNPNATLDDLYPIVDTAYSLASQGRLAETNASLAQQQQAQEAARQRKIQAESLTGGGPTRTAPKDEQEAYWEKLKGMDTGEFRLGNSV